MTAALFGLDVVEESWRDDALCAQVGYGDLWFPEKGGSVREAKQVCARCDVRAECLDFALANDERHGVWAGLTERERRKVAAERRRARQPKPAPVVVQLASPPPPSEPKPPAAKRPPRPWTTAEAREAVRTLTWHGMSAEEIARELGISSRTVTRIRSAQRGAA